MKAKNSHLVSEIKTLYAKSDLTSKQIADKYNLNRNTVKGYCKGVKKIIKKPDFNTGMLLESLIGGFFFEGNYTKEEIYNAVEKYHGVNDNNYYGLKSRI